MTTPLTFLDGSVPFVFDGRDRMVLPRQFTPGHDVVIIGRGKKVQQHPANIRFRALIQSQLEAYSNAATKGLKSNILWRVLNEVRGYSTSRLGFVKRDTESGRWYAIEDASAKINISQAFRDGLHSDYKSSKKRKQLKRKAELGDSPSSSPRSSPSPGLTRQDIELENHILSALNEKLERSSPSPPPNKRICVATNRALTTSDPSDYSLGRLGSSSMDRLRNFLTGPHCVPMDPQSNQIDVDLKASTLKRTDSWDSDSDTFAGLFKKFGTTNKFSEDPFEPKPIKSRVDFATISKLEPIASESLKKVTLGLEPDVMVFPHFATSSVFDEAIPEDNAALIGSVNKLQNDFDSSICLKEAMLPSIMSLSSLELSDQSGLKSISSLSTISDCQELQDLHDAWDRMDSDRSMHSRNAQWLLQAS